MCKKQYIYFLELDYAKLGHCNKPGQSLHEYLQRPSCRLDFLYILLQLPIPRRLVLNHSSQLGVELKL